MAFPNESSEYRAARDELLADEIALRRQMEAVSEARRAFRPGGAVREDYVFETIGVDGAIERVRMSELFGEYDSILMYQMMFPRWRPTIARPAASGETAKLALKDQPCPSYTAWSTSSNAQRTFRGGGAGVLCRRQDGDRKFGGAGAGSRLEPHSMAVGGGNQF